MIRSPQWRAQNGTPAFFASGHIRAGILCRIIPRSHQCGDPLSNCSVIAPVRGSSVEWFRCRTSAGDFRHLSKCFAHFLQLRCFRGIVYLAIDMPWAPPECPAGSMPFLDEHYRMLFRDVSHLASALESPGYSDMQDSVAYILPNRGSPSCEEQNPFLPAFQVTHYRTFDKMFPQPLPHSGMPDFILTTTELVFSHHLLSLIPNPHLEPLFW